MKQIVVNGHKLSNKPINGGLEFALIKVSVGSFIGSFYFAKKLS